MTTTMITTPGGGSGVTVMSGTVYQQGTQLPQHPYFGTHVAPPSVRVAPTTRSSRAEAYLSRQSMGLGITLIVTGVLAVIFNGVGFAVSDSLAAVSHGFYCGAMFIITGSFGAAAATSKNKCVIVTFMVLSIISAVLTINLLIVGIVGAAVNQCYHADYGYSRCSSNNYYNNLEDCSYVAYRPPCQNAAVAMEAMQACLAVVAAIVSIWGSAICCKAVCCCSNSTYGGAILSAQYANNPIVIIEQQQAMGTAMYGRPQVIPGAPMSYQLNTQYWAAPPVYQPQGQVATMPTYDNDAVSTIAGSNVPPPAYSTTTATAPIEIPYKI